MNRIRPQRPLPGKHMSVGQSFLSLYFWLCLPVYYLVDSNRIDLVKVSFYKKDSTVCLAVGAIFDRCLKPQKVMKARVLTRKCLITCWKKHLRGGTGSPRFATELWTEHRKRKESLDLRPWSVWRAALLLLPLHRCLAQAECQLGMRSGNTGLSPGGREAFWTIPFGVCTHLLPSWHKQRSKRGTAAPNSKMLSESTLSVHLSPPQN